MDAAILDGWDNIFYYTGMTSYQSTVQSPNVMPVVITKDKVIAIVTNGFAKSMLQNYPHIENFLAFSEDEQIMPWMSRKMQLKVALANGPSRIGLDFSFCHLPIFYDFREAIPGASFTDISPIVYRQRMVKDDDELNAISEAAKITDQIYCEMVTRHVHEGMTEWQVALSIRRLAADFGCTVPFFQVFAGPRAYFQNNALGGITVLKRGM